MTTQTSSFYARWRQSRGRSATLHESRDGHPPERLLQAIWVRQRIQRDRLQASDGRSVRVLHPGFWNREAGPDFRGAVVQFGGDAPVTGDVEVDVRGDGWRTHGHDRNPAFAGVVLHVIWDRPVSNSVDCPTLVMRDRLDAPVGELTELLEGELPPPLAGEQQGLCSAPLQALETDALRELLREAARVRFATRASQLRARARQAGWEQTLIEGLMRALGYKHNAWPMQHLGELGPQFREALKTTGHAADPLHWQTLLLGTSGFLPDDVTRSSTATAQYIRQVWDIWWRDRDRFAAVILPKSLWRMNGIRPANHPHRRLGLAAHWLADEKFFKRLETWFGDWVKLAAGNDPVPRTTHELRKLSEALDPGRDSFWSRHWTLRSRAMAKAQPLLGPTRATDLAVNVILPWFFVRAHEGRNTNWSAAAEAAWFAWPAAEDNTVLRLARARLLGNARRNVLKTAADQQGLLQIVRDFCDHSNAVCEQCRFPELVAEWSGTGKTP